MTTRAGITGLLTGLMATVIIYLLFLLEPLALLGRSRGSTISLLWITSAGIGMLFSGGGWFAAHRSGSTQRWRCVVLGALAGALAGMVVFCLWGAAAAGQAEWVQPRGGITDVTVPNAGLISTLIDQTVFTFMVFFLAGGGLGAAGGCLARLRRKEQTDEFDKQAPQMAMNVSITALPASILAVEVAAVVFPWLKEFVGGNSLDHPLLIAILLVLVSHLALTLVVPHEARQAEHRCGIDEVKMAGFVGIAAAPVWIIALGFVYPNAFLGILVIIASFFSLAMSAINTVTLVRLILPRRATFPEVQAGGRKNEALLFGSIAGSHARRLIVLCIGCGLAMVLPVGVCVLSVLVNLSSVRFESGVVWGLFLKQALVSVGMSAAAIGLLVMIYMLYLSLGRAFHRRTFRLAN